MAEERMLITGGQRLEGTVHVSGGKNTSVAVISASILSQTPCVIWVRRSIGIRMPA